MWSDIVVGYGIFILEILTILLVVAGIIAMIFAFKQRQPASYGELKITDLSKEYADISKKLQQFHMTEEELKQAEKEEKKAEKAKANAEKAKRKKGETVKREHKPTLYVLNFKGDIQASPAAWCTVTVWRRPN